MPNYDNAAFKKRLAKIPKMVRKAMREAIEKDAEEWVRLAQSIAPVDPEDGVFLKPSVRSEPTETGGQVVRAGGKTTIRQTENGPYDYAVGQEYGTRHMPASPFFWPAYRSLKKRFTSRRRRALSKAVKEWNDG